MSETEESQSEAQEGQSSGAGLEQEMSQIQDRMAEIKDLTEEELIRDWPSPWRNEAMTEAKVSGRLSSHKEYQSLLQRLREIKKQLGVVAKPREMEEAEDPMGSYALKLAHAERDKEQ
jgi:hypothetical protein